MLLLSFILTSCSDQPCYENRDPLMNTSLLASGTGESAKSDSLRIFSLREGDTLNFINVKITSYFSLPLDPAADESVFHIILDGVTDTMTILYNRTPHLVSPECGYTIVSEITKVYSTHNIIDTLIIENKNVNLSGPKNLHLFY